MLQVALGKIGIKAKVLSEPWPVVSDKMRDEKQMYDLGLPVEVDLLRGSQQLGR